MTEANIGLKERIEGAFSAAEKQVHRLTEEHPDYFPVYTVNGKWKHTGEAWTNWCEGFLGGMMWIFSARSLSSGTRRDGADSDRSPHPWREKAEHYSRLIEHRKTDRNVHDLGFLFWSTYKRWFDLTGDRDVQDVVITAGQTMGLRFKEKGEYLRSFVAEDSLFIDIMMNVGIVFYAALETGDDELLRKAHLHCRTTRRTLVRGDGSTAHEGLFDPETGEFLGQSTHQGYRGDSAWARGLTWGLYGFGTAYKLTGKRPYLETAKLCADFFLGNTSFEGKYAGVPPNDYDDPRRPVLYDSSAAAIAASGLLQLSELIQDGVYADTYRNAAFTILYTLTGPDFLATPSSEWEGILKHGVYHLDKGLGVDESVMWGEYFFVEALDRAACMLERQTAKTGDA